jgi:hypothetical protein
MRPVSAIVLVFVCLLAAGCGSGNLKPQGRLLKKGAPYVPAEGETVHLAFFPDDEDQPDRGSYPAEMNREDGTFRVLGTDGRGLPPGKYRATVQIMKNRKDILQGAYGRTRSPFSIDLTSATGEITLDLDTPPRPVANTQRRDNRRQ